MIELNGPATDVVRIARYLLSMSVPVGSLAYDTSDKSSWVAFKVEEDKNGKNVSYRPNVTTG